MVQATTDSSGRLEFHSDFKLPTDARLKIEGLYPNADMNNSQIAFELTKNCECGGIDHSPDSSVLSEIRPRHAELHVHA